MDIYLFDDDDVRGLDSQTFSIWVASIFFFW